MPILICMSDLIGYAAHLAHTLDGHVNGDGDAARLPPVDQWTPDYCGRLDLTIRRDGVWVHEGTPISRPHLVRLFSTILKKEGDTHYLVTPVEKLSIHVEDVPFVMTGMTIDHPGTEQIVTLVSNMGDEVTLTGDTPLIFRDIPMTDNRAPYVTVRRNLEGRLARPVYYELAQTASPQSVNGAERFGFWSTGHFFDFDDGLDRSLWALSP
ncbi:MAG: DUF1285 domain-containing protein [Pseudomonadota bacterium]